MRPESRGHWPPRLADKLPAPAVRQSTCRRFASCNLSNGLKTARHPTAPQNWSARHGLIFLGGSIAVVALIVSAWLQVNRPRGVMVVNRLMPASDRKDAPWTDSSIEWLTGFKTLSPGEVWLTWSTTMPVGADPRLTIYGMRAQYAESRMAIDSRDYRYLAWAFGAVGVVLLAAGLLIPQPEARRGPAQCAQAQRPPNESRIYRADWSGRLDSLWRLA